MRENLIWIALIALMISLAAFYLEKEQKHQVQCSSQGGWYFKAHCFKDGKDI